MKRYDTWAIKITFITFCLGMLISLASELASSASGIVVAGMIIIFLLVVSVLTDAIAVAVAASDVEEFAALASVSPNNKTIKLAHKLVKNKDRVNNICADVIGDVCSILNGACGATIALEVMRLFQTDKLSLLVSITFSSILAALTVGGKAMVKSIAIGRSREFVLYSAKIIRIFTSPFDKIHKRSNKIRKS